MKSNLLILFLSYIPFISTLMALHSEKEEVKVQRALFLKVSKYIST